MRDRILATTRAVETVREYEIEHPGITPIEVDMDEFMKVTDVLERMYSPGHPTFTPPTVMKIPSAYKRTNLKSISGAPVMVYASPTKDEVIIHDPNTGKPLRYRLYRKTNAEEIPILDSYYLTMITQGEWYYYMPAGREFEAFQKGEEIVTNTHYAIDWENGTIIDYPYGATAGPGDDLRNRNIMRAAVMATLINPKLFRQTATRYLSGSIDASEMQRIMDKINNQVIEYHTPTLRERLAELERQLQENPTLKARLQYTLLSMAIHSDP